MRGCRRPRTLSETVSALSALERARLPTGVPAAPARTDSGEPPMRHAMAGQSLRDGQLAHRVLRPPPANGVAPFA